MVEHEFKAKRQDNGKWEYGYYVKSTVAGEGYILSAFENMPDLERGDLYIVEIIPETVCWYIRYKDKNNQKIYENDIVKFKIQEIENTEFIGIIKYIKGEIRIVDVYNIKKHCNLYKNEKNNYIKLSNLLIVANSIEVIDNIYNKPSPLYKIIKNEKIEKRDNVKHIKINGEDLLELFEYYTGMFGVKTQEKANEIMKNMEFDVYDDGVILKNGKFWDNLIEIHDNVKIYKQFKTWYNKTKKKYEKEK